MYFIFFDNLLLEVGVKVGTYRGNKRVQVNDISQSYTTQTYDTFQYSTQKI